MTWGGAPADMAIEDVIVYKTLQNGKYVEVRLVKRPRQYEAAIFVDGKYLPGPPLPRPLDASKDDVTHWMGVRPSVGLTFREVEVIEERVRSVNESMLLKFKDTWGKDEFEDV